MRELPQPSRRALLAGAALVVALLGGFAAVVVDAQRDSRRGLEDRFRLRSALAADFVQSYLVETARQEGTVARSRLAGPSVSRREFEAVVERFQFTAAVLLDPQGRVLHVYPRRADLIGARITDRYVHLRGALQGRIGVSDVVPSAARSTPVVAVAVPYQALGGLRVFSGAFPIERSPITAFLHNSIPLRLGSARLFDSKGRVIAATGEPGDDAFVATTPVSLTDWRVELAAPRSLLFAPISGLARWVPWALFTGFALASFAILVLVLRLLRSQAALRERSDEVMRLVDVQRGFVATTAHELRTPLTSVAGFLDYLLHGKAGEVTDDQREYLEIARRNAERVQDLVADLLVAAQIDSGELQLRREEITLDAVARETVESAVPVAESKGVELVLQADDGTPVLADRMRLAQVVGNLVSNAVKFTPAEGRVEVRAFRENGHSVIEVSDTGIGIPEEEHDRLFQRFYRAGTALERDIPGTGLGLAISRDITELHGGRLVFSSAAGVGSTFRVELPTAE